ncbi:MAG: histidine kinase [Prolixibacteraceae bacterium]|jgi:two-component system LytT family sensor kinase|nr:histidine kinase [Prolixibacteraceae bacterium]
MRYNWKFFKWMVIVGCVPALYFNFISRVSGWNDPCYPFFDNLLIWLGISIGLTLIMSFIVFKEIIWLEKILPWRKSPAKRILVEFPLVLLTTSLIMGMFSHSTYSQHIKSFGTDFYNSFSEYIARELSISGILTIIVVTMVEGVFFFKEWQKNMVLTEKLQKEAMQSQLEVLKNQVNPHFLFNSLNVLSSLVYSSPEKAEAFIEKFASVYRYILNIQGKMVVPLKDELEFLNAYLYLQKIRFNEGLNIQISIEEEKQALFIPPLCLQQLVENAIKHNVVGAEKPLSIEVYNKGDDLFVVNNLQKRDEPLSSTGVGLKNLTNRYFHFANVKPEFKEENMQFIAKAPLLMMTPKDD